MHSHQQDSCTSFLPIVVNGNILHLRRIGEEVNDSIQQWLDPFVLEG